MSGSGSGEFSGRTIVVTGCSSGIGLAVSELLLAAGAHVIGLDRNPCPLEVEFHAIDLDDPGSIDAAASAIPGPVHGLVNAAGVSSGIGDPLKVLSINFLGLRQLTEALAARMPQDSYIVSTSSLSARDYRAHQDAVLDLLAQPDRAAVLAWCAEHPDEVGAGYNLSKEAVISYTAQRAMEFAARGIRINATAPGVTETPILADTIRSLGRQFLDDLPKPLGRLATPLEQARVLVFLVGDGAAYITGQTIWVDGGYMAGVETGQISPFPAGR